MDSLRDLTATDKKPIIVDPKPHHADYHRHVTLTTPNNTEASTMTGIPIEDPETLMQAGEHLLARLDCQMVLVTRGEAGMALFQRGRAMTTIPTVARRVYDVTGAGDTVVSTITLALLAGLAPAVPRFWPILPPASWWVKWVPPRLPPSVWFRPSRMACDRGRDHLP